MNIQDVKQIVLGGGNNPSQIRQAWVNNKQIWPIDNTEEEVMSHLFGWWDASKFSKNNYDLNKAGDGILPSKYKYNQNLKLTPLENYYTLNDGIGYSSNQIPLTENVNFKINFDESFTTVTDLYNGGILITIKKQDSFENAFEITGVKDYWFEVQLISPTDGIMNPWLSTLVSGFQEFIGDGFRYVAVKANDSLKINKLYEGTVTILVNYGSSTPDYNVLTINNSLRYTGNNFPVNHTIIAKFNSSTARYNATLGKINFNNTLSNENLPMNETMVLDSSSGTVRYFNSSGGLLYYQDFELQSNSPTIEISVNNSSWSSGTLGALKLEYLIVFDTVLTDEQKRWVYNNMIKK